MPPTAAPPIMPITLPELARRAGRSYWSVRRALAAKKLDVPLIKIGAYYLIPAEHVDQAVKQMREFGAER